MSLTLNELKKRFKKIKLIVSDIDGTLVNSNNELSQHVKDIVKKLHEKNIYFSLASQRVHSSIFPLAKELEIKIPYISLNGSLIQDNGGETVLNKAVIDKKYVLKAIKLAERHYVKIALCYKDEIIYTEDNSVVKDFMSRLGTTYTLVKSYDNYLDSVLEIIMTGNDRKIMKHIHSKMQLPFGIYLKVKYNRSQSFSGVYNVDIIRKGINKRKGLNTLAKYLKVKKDEVLVFGDWYNDKELFLYGGTNIALKNAVDELKEIADYVTDRTNDEDGVGEFLKMFYDTIK